MKLPDLPKYKRQEFIFIISLLGYFLILFSQTFQYTRPARLFPFVIFSILFVLVVIKIVGYFSTHTRFEPKEDFLDFSNMVDKAGLEKKERQDNIKTRKEVLFVITWLTCFLISIYLIGFIYAVIVFPIVFLAVMSRMSWLKIVAISLGILGLIYLIFVILLDVPFSKGIF